MTNGRKHIFFSKPLVTFFWNILHCQNNHSQKKWSAKWYLYSIFAYGLRASTERSRTIGVRETSYLFLIDLDCFHENSGGWNYRFLWFLYENLEPKLTRTCHRASRGRPSAVVRRENTRRVTLTWCNARFDFQNRSTHTHARIHR